MWFVKNPGSTSGGRGVDIDLAAFAALNRLARSRNEFAGEKEEFEKMGNGTAKMHKCSRDIGRSRRSRRLSIESCESNSGGTLSLGLSQLYAKISFTSVLGSGGRNNAFRARAKTNVIIDRAHGVRENLCERKFSVYTLNRGNRELTGGR